MARFVWFWTFWHWSIEGYRSGSLLRGPIHGIAGHWEEWYGHEASEEDRHAIETAGRSPWTQREFVRWLARRWAREATWRGTRPAARFVLAHLARQAPFSGWTTFDAYRAGYGARGISAVVLAEGSAGVAADVRSVEAVLLPGDAAGAAQTVVAEGFEADRSELLAARQAALDLLGGRGLWLLLAQWVVTGLRPYPLWLKAVLTACWATVGGMIAYLLVGPEPGDRLVPIGAALLLLWSALVLTAAIATAMLAFGGWRQGRALSDLLRSGQVWLRMTGGLTVVGGSAGLPFCLNILLAVIRAHPRPNARSWIWRRLVAGLRASTDSWAATGVVAADGRVQPVVLEPKLLACVRHGRIRQVLTPRQDGAKRKSLSRLIGSLGRIRRAFGTAGTESHSQLGFAADGAGLRCRPCRYVAQAAMAVGNLGGPARLGMAAFASVLSVVMLAGLPDLRNMLVPPPPPTVVGSSSVSQYDLWVSLETRHPESFEVVLESGFWANRRADVTAAGRDGAARAEMRLRRLSSQTALDVEDGTIWIERRRRFITREFDLGPRVGRYSFSYVIRRGNE